MEKTLDPQTCSSTRSFIQHFLIFLILLSISNNLAAQKDYFQQKVHYRINVSLDDKLNVLNGNMSIAYTNNSPDTLRFIWMHLWPNGYKDRNTALNKQLLEDGSSAFYFADKNERGYIDSLSFEINERKVKTEYDAVNADICKLILDNPLLPGQVTVITTPFRVKLPNAKFSRLGYTGDAFYISQWYPKPAVYDNKGWHPIPYLNFGEFYSEFGKYEVSITLPENYVVAATGSLQDENEKLWLKEKRRLTVEMKSFISIDSFPESSVTLKTISFVQDSIHDFAWFADKRFHVLTEVVTIPSTGKTVSASVYFTNKKASFWVNTPGYIRKGLLFLSEEVGAYPYNSFSVVDGTIAAGGGMEYPMITIINTPGTPQSLEVTVFHELCHNWFYGILASNEYKDGWMDEGITSWFELKYTEKFLYGTEKGKNSLTGSAGPFGKLTGLDKKNAFETLNLIYKASSHNNSDQPIRTPSTQFTEMNYGTVMYTKTAIAFEFLNDYLGDSLFRKCMRDYYQNWKFKHPDPDDIRESFEKSSGENLDWFFDGLLLTSKPVKFKINITNDTALNIKNGSGIRVPLKVENEHGEFFWLKGFRDTTNITMPFRKSDRIFLNKDYSTLFKSCNLPYRTGSYRKQLPSLRFKNFYQVEDEPGTETLYLLPVPAWNSYNHWMAGVYFSNMDFIPEQLEFNAVPLYDFGNKSIMGLAGIEYKIWPLQGLFREVKFSINAKRFAYADNNSIDKEFRDKYPVFFYSKVAAGLKLSLRKNNARSPVSQSIGYRNISVWLDEVQFRKVDSVYVRDFTNTLLNYNELTWTLINSRIVDPYSLNLKGEQGSDHLKLSLEFNYRFSYKKNKKGIDIRLFAGGFLVNETTRNYNFRMSGWPGSQDYLFDEIYFGRNDQQSTWSRQFLVRDGGFKTPTFVGQTNKWLVAVNVNIDVPAPLPIRLFFDAGTYEGISTVFDGITGKVMFDGGISLSAIKDVLEIYVPLFVSEDIKRSHEVNNIKFADQIRFVLNIHKLSPMNLRNQAIEQFQ